MSKQNRVNRLFAFGARGQGRCSRCNLTPYGDGVLVCCMLDTVSVLTPPGCARARLRKLMYRVVFPFELKLRNVADECDDADDVFHLFAVVVHVGSGLNHGALEGPCEPMHACGRSWCVSAATCAMVPQGVACSM
jgi:hypothetical protein